MAHTLSAKKRIRQSEKRKIRNKSNKSFMKTTVKKVDKAIISNDPNLPALLKAAVSTINKAVRLGKIHRNQAARKVSRLTLKFNAAMKASSNS